MDRIAIIGAGMAGLSAAQALVAQGCDCTLFEKSRGLGGRMATRRADGLQFDHGAQYFTARGAGFTDLTGRMQAAGAVSAWQGGGFVGIPGMSAPARWMAQNIAEKQDHFRIVQPCAVSAMRRDAAGWHLADANGPLRHGPFDAVLTAIPAPQVAPLLATAGAGFAALDRVRYAPCWAVMLGFDGPTGVEGTAVAGAGQRLADGPIGWIAHDGGKPGRGDAATVVLHASPAWSRAHLEEDAASVASLLLAEAVQRFALGVPSYSAAHRWRYALVETVAGEPCLWDASLGVGACGDWALGARVEAAHDSGVALAAALVASRKVRA